jgi:hypothetical protein
MTITNLVRNERPLMFFALLALLLVVIAVALGIPVILDYLDTGLVPRFPTAILASALMVIAVISLATGAILDLVAHVRREAKRLVYLQHPAPARPGK